MFKGFILLVLATTLFSNELYILGLTQKEALYLSKDYIGYNACSPEHTQGDVANRWCHGAFIKVVEATLVRDMQINKYIANILAASVFLPKEYLIDLHPSNSDLAIIDFPIRENIALTLFADGLIYLEYNKKF